MTVIEEWTGRHAHALRTALRLTNEAFADQLGISPRTLTKWRERPELVPSPFLQEALDTYLKKAPPDAHLRFAANLGLHQGGGPIDKTVLTQLNTALGDLTRVLARLQAEDPERSPSP
ncbi:helix-turn-helix domain-containing protein [Kribbella speibonae]|uniref:XRE family transcriptional regulator n=1 Tax=Kribbella speibonae TaxID=1572660 RepID=A0ABY2A571_9ACTN|nr:helix-turn-helix domain-containing protein [Kribbella speibonae]TCC22188.1 XRE family transcriptional regulator [Kribbella speibonae]